MSAHFSRLARHGSHSSTSSSSSIDKSSHNHLFRSLHIEIPHWRDQIWTHTNQRNERIATGTIARGTAILTRELMEMHIQTASDVRSFTDCLPNASLAGNTFVGWRQKGNTW